MTSYVANHLLPSLFTHGHTTFIRKTRHLPKSWEHTNDGFYHEHPDVLDGTFQMIGFLVLSTATEVWVPLVPVPSQCTEQGTSIDRGRRSGYVLGWRMRTVPLVDIESTDASSTVVLQSCVSLMQINDVEEATRCDGWCKPLDILLDTGYGGTSASLRK